MSYNLDDQATESFEFTLESHIYVMRYPTTEEILENQGLQDKKDGGKAMLEWIYGYITPKDPSSPAFPETMKKVNVKKLQRFNEMLKTEMGMGAEA